MYKIMTKIIANRLRLVLPKIISSNQDSFIVGLHIMDNIVIAQEVIHLMRTKKGKTAWLAIKVDLEKVYNRM